LKQLRWMVSGLLAVAVIGDGVLTCWDWRVRSHAPERSREAVVRAGGSGGIRVNLMVDLGGRQA
jgi:hypothetical protein